MADPNSDFLLDSRISLLTEFKTALQKQFHNDYTEEHESELKSFINRNLVVVKNAIRDAGTQKRITIAPPPAVGGLVIQNADPFDDPFGTYWGFSVIPTAIDSIEQAIGVYEHMKSEVSVESSNLKAEAQIDIQMVRNYAFVAMPMDPNNPELDAVLDAIKEGAARCGVQAERIDEPASNERITDRILESIRKAEYVIVDLTHAKPNVYYEAGYAHGLGKIPIYPAKEGTKLEFDLKDYPVIFFRNMKQLTYRSLILEVHFQELEV